MEKVCRSLIPTPEKISIRFRLNWFVLHTVTFLNGLVVLIAAPSLHQFITSSTSNSNTTNDDVEPGLGLSETWYSMEISIASFGTFIGALVFGIIAKQVYTKIGLIVELLLVLSSGVLYSFSNNGWLILLSRFLAGLFPGVHMALMRVYVFETSEKLIQQLPPDKRAKSTIKYTAAFVMFAHATIGTMFGPVVVAIAAQIPGISEFHWPGYYLTGHSLVLLVLVVLLFNERWLDVTRGSPNKTSIKSKLMKELKEPTIPHYLSFVFICLYFLFGWSFSILETLQNPILSDQFGLNIETTSYVFIGSTSIYFMSILVMYVFQKLRFDNRNILIGASICGLAGSIIMIDWQSLGGDPCSIYSNDASQESSGDYSDIMCNSSIHHDCFWNPISRITGEYCERCREVCLSKSHSLNFIQLIIGMILVTLYALPGRVLVSTIASDIAGKNAQPALLFGLLVAAAEITRTSGPLWANPAYIGVNHRTWLPMMILCGLLLTGLGLIAAFYRKMKKTVKLNNTDGLSNGINEDAIELLSSEEIDL